MKRPKFKSAIGRVKLFDAVGWVRTGILQQHSQKFTIGTDLTCTKSREID